MDRRSFLKKAAISSVALGLAGCSSKALTGAHETERPNILVIFDDQHRYSALGCSGNKVVQTPNIDRFANDGLVFDNAFSCCPICAPFRAQLLTGKYPHKNGVLCNEYMLWENQVTLGQVLQGEGYHTGFFGKLHLGYGPYTEEKRKPLGFDEMEATSNCEHNLYGGEYYDNEKGPFKSDKWLPIIETDRALDFMEKHLDAKSGRPFFAALAWEPPHWSAGKQVYTQYPEEFKTYDPEKVDLPPNVPEEITAKTRQEIADYYGSITALDEQFGRVMSFLEERGIVDNTIIIFTSDHGDHIGSHGYGKPGSKELPHHKRASKATPYNESIHIPFIIRDPKNGLRGKRTDSLFSSVDIMPTLLGLCGMEIPEGVQGDDLSHLVRGKKGYEKDSVYLQILGLGWPDRLKWVGYWRGVRTKRWVYARWRNNSKLLFDCENDPYEMNNLAGKEEYAEIQSELEGRLKKWISDTEDPFETGKRNSIGMLEIGQKLSSDRFDKK